MIFSRKKNFLVLIILFLPFLLYLCFVPIVPILFDTFSTFSSKYQSIVNQFYTKDYLYSAISVLNSPMVATSLTDVPKKLAHPPAVLKAVYVTGWSAGSKNYLDYLDTLFKTTQINAVVIDVKDASGIVSYATDAKKAKEYRAYYPEIPDINELIKNLHQKEIYVIGRVVVFEDPILAKNRPDLAIYDKSKMPTLSNIHDKIKIQNPKQSILWQDSSGLSWVDPSSPEVADYNIEIAKDAASHGFDEINFDYVRFPTDGKKETMGFPIWDSRIPKNFVIKSFFQKLRPSLPDIKISADLFGQVTTNTDDMGIGQIWEDSLNYFDYVCPMVYPSHYANGFLGYKNPAQYPYQIIAYALGSALAREKVFEKVHSTPKIEAPYTSNTLPPPVIEEAQNSQTAAVLPSAKIRPWLQNFNIGATYDGAMVGQEIKAVTDSLGNDFSGYLLWSPSNIYAINTFAPKE